MGFLILWLCFSNDMFIFSHIGEFQIPFSLNVFHSSSSAFYASGIFIASLIGSGVCTTGYQSPDKNPGSHHCSLFCLSSSLFFLKKKMAQFTANGLFKSPGMSGAGGIYKSSLASAGVV